MSTRSSSKSKQNTSNTSVSQGIQGANNGAVISGDGNTTTTANIDGDYVGGNLTNNDYEYELEQSGNANNSGLINDGSYIGGNSYVTDGGAFDLVGDMVDSLEVISKINSDNMADTAENALKEGFGSLDILSGHAESMAKAAFENSTKQAEFANLSAQRNMEIFSQELSHLAGEQFASVESMTNSLINQTQSTLAANVQLAQSAQTGGASVVAEQSSEMVMYVMGGVALVAVMMFGAMMLRSRK